MNNAYESAREYLNGALDNIPDFGKRRTSLGLVGWFIAGAAVGTAAMYFLDPTEGKRRRMQIRERGIAWKNSAASLTEKTRGWKESMQGAWARFTGSKDEESAHLASKGLENPSYLH